ncbi:MAG: glycoside hydrolase family 97 catalytic domain-containing protein [Lacibacter sp.]
MNIKNNGCLIKAKYCLQIKMTFFYLILFLFNYQKVHAQTVKAIIINSPDQSTVFEAKADKNGQLVYRILFKKNAVTNWSVLGIKTDANEGISKVSINKTNLQSKNEKFAWVFGERDSIINHYNEVTINCVAETLNYDVVARVFNGSIAFRYKLSKASASIKRFHKEITSFQFATDYTLYQYNQESVFTPVGIDTFSKTCDFPATLTNGKLFLQLGEACNNQFTKAELKRGILPHSLIVSYIRDSAVNINNEELTAWRTISIATSAIGLHQFSDLNFRLSPSAIENTPVTIKPGKLIRSQLNTQSGLECIDFAVKHNLQYIMFDAGWYGAEFRTSSDPTQVIPSLDLPKVIAYGKQKGIGVILYVNYVGLRAKLDTILPLYKEWGVAGLKFGFVDGLTQKGILWLKQAIQKVNEFGFVLDIHDNYKPTGLSRTYPALLTQEGIRGDENSPDAFHTTVLPFTRFLAGPADFTFCYPNSKESFSKNLKVSKAHQLALSVVYYSPLQSLYWYGKPLDYKNDLETDFFDHIPTVWNESLYIAGAIGENICVARKNENTWFLGAVAGLNDWSTSVKLSFLNKGASYEASVYEDDGKGSIAQTTLIVKKGDTFPLTINAKSGKAVIIRLISK